MIITILYNIIEEQVGYIFRFVLYQMSKNLSRPFFMDFLTCLSVRFSQKGEEFDTDSDNGTSPSPILIIFANLQEII